MGKWRSPRIAQKGAAQMLLELSVEERDLIRYVLERFLSDLREEIYKTESYDYRVELHRQEELLRGLLQRLAGLAEPAPSP